MEMTTMRRALALAGSGSRRLGFGGDVGRLFRFAERLRSPLLREPRGFTAPLIATVTNAAAMSCRI